MLSQKIADQCRWSARKPPSAGPQAPGGRVGDGEIAVVAPALARRRDVAQHHHAHGGEPAAADALQGAPQDQHQHGGRERANERAGEVDRDGDAQREGAPVDVGDLAVERDDGGRRQQIGGDQPGQVMGIAEVAPDRRQGARQDGLVERAHEDRQQHAEHDEQRLPVGEPLGLGRVGDGVHGLAGGLDRGRAGRIVRLVEQASMPGQPRPADAGPAGHACCTAPKIVPVRPRRKFRCPAAASGAMNGSDAARASPSIADAARRLYLLAWERPTPSRLPAGPLPAQVRDEAQAGPSRRQIRPGASPGLRHRLSGAGAPVPDAEGARPSRRPQHRRLCHRLPRLAARRARPAVPARAGAAALSRRPVPGRHQRGAGRHRAVGHAAGRAAPRRQVRRRVRHLVRQGSGRRPHRRRVPPRQFRRHLAPRRRARADGRRPHRRILHHRAPVRISLHRRDDPDPQSGGRAGDHRLRPLRLGDVALHRRLGGAQMHARDGRVDRRGGRRASSG